MLPFRTAGYGRQQQVSTDLKDKSLDELYHTCVCVCSCARAGARMCMHVHARARVHQS